MDVVLVGVVLSGVENHSLSVLRRALSDAGLESRTLAFTGWVDLEATLSTLLRWRPRVVGLSIQTNQMAMAALSLARMLRQRGFSGRVVCGGHFATLNADDILRSPAGVDAVVRFAGEEALIGLARGATEDDELAALPGILWRSKDGSVRTGAPARVDGENLVHAPERDRELPVHLGFPSADLILSRGCEAHCAYCCVAGASDLARREAARAQSERGRQAGYHRRTVDAIAQEISTLWHERGARVFNFMDDNILPLDPALALGWLDDLRAALAKARVGRMAFAMQLRADAASPAVLDSLVELGLVRAYVGVDAASPTQLRTIGRHAPVAAGPSALDGLAERGVFAVCNALIVGPTFRFESVLAEIAVLENIRHAPVHLYPIDVRAGTSYLAAAEKRGLVEGGFLWRRYRFEDERTALVAAVLNAMPTRLAERSVAIGLYDLGYNLGIARRLVSDADVAGPCATYASVARRWNADQLRLLRAAAEPAARLDHAAIAELTRKESERVRAIDAALLGECDEALVAVERAVSRALGKRARPHARGRMLSALAISMSLAACDGDVITADDMPVVDGSTDLAVRPNPDASCSAEVAPDECQLFGTCHDSTTVQLTFDGSGRVTAIGTSDGGTLSSTVQDCYKAFFQSYCYPSLAGTTQSVFPHCFIA